MPGENISSTPNIESTAKLGVTATTDENNAMTTDKTIINESLAANAFGLAEQNASFEHQCK